MPEFFANLLARIAFPLIRYWILHWSDQWLAKSIRVMRRIVYAFSGDQMVLNAFNDLIGIFETGGWETELVRKIVRETTPEYAITILRSILRKD